MKGAVVQDVKVQQESSECCKVLLLCLLRSNAPETWMGGYWKLLNGVSIYVSLSRTKVFLQDKLYHSYDSWKVLWQKKDYLKE